MKNPFERSEETRQANFAAGASIGLTPEQVEQAQASCREVEKEVWAIVKAHSKKIGAMTPGRDEDDSILGFAFGSLLNAVALAASEEMNKPNGPLNILACGRSFLISLSSALQALQIEMSKEETQPILITPLSGAAKE